MSLPPVQEIDKARKRLKQLYRRNELMEELRNCLADFKSGCAETNLPFKEYVVDQLLSTGSKKQKEKMAEFLRTLGYPVNRVVKRKEKELMRRRQRSIKGTSPIDGPKDS